MGGKGRVLKKFGRTRGVGASEEFRKRCWVAWVFKDVSSRTKREYEASAKGLRKGSSLDLLQIGSTAAVGKVSDGSVVGR